MAVIESMKESIFISMLWYSASSKASGPYYEQQWWSLWQSLFPSPWYGSSFLVKLQFFTINGSDEVYDRVCCYSMELWYVAYF